jgi:hypothetical protein
VGVSSYAFSPGFVTVRQGDTVQLTVFIVNGDKHDVSVSASDGRKIVADTVWNRGREYHVRFVAEQAGAYQLVCSEHAPSMIATFLALHQVARPREGISRRPPSRCGLVPAHPVPGREQRLGHRQLSRPPKESPGPETPTRATPRAR